MTHIFRLHTFLLSSTKFLFHLFVLTYCDGGYYADKEVAVSVGALRIPQLPGVFLSSLPS